MEKWFFGELGQVVVQVLLRVSCAVHPAIKDALQNHRPMGWPWIAVEPKSQMDLRFSGHGTLDPPILEIGPPPDAGTSLKWQPSPRGLPETHRISWGRWLWRCSTQRARSSLCAFGKQAMSMSPWCKAKTHPTRDSTSAIPSEERRARHCSESPQPLAQPQLFCLLLRIRGESRGCTASCRPSTGN